MSSAEAVETEAEANWLREAGVGCLQGYLFGRRPSPRISAAEFFRHGRQGLVDRTKAG
jgi:EAL domain-containing protein (putative c-di-GMP-specific phosphodiesterase class I)